MYVDPLHNIIRWEGITLETLLSARMYTPGLGKSNTVMNSYINSSITCNDCCWHLSHDYTPSNKENSLCNVMM